MKKKGWVINMSPLTSFIAVSERNCLNDDHEKRITKGIFRIGIGKFFLGHHLYRREDRSTAHAGIICIGLATVLIRIDPG